MREMPAGQCEEHVRKAGERRTSIQAGIKELTDKRDAFVKQEMAKRNLGENQSFDAALRRAIREQAVKKGFTFESK